MRDADRDDVMAICRFGEEHGLGGGEHVIRKLYTLPRYRGSGSRLLEVLIGRLPADVGRVYAEHLFADESAGLFFEREGFTVERIEPGGVVRRVRGR